MSKQPKGIHRAGDLSVCMVVGCQKKALYRRGHSQRGYCHVHRASATAPLSDHEQDVVMASFERWAKVGK